MPPRDRHANICRRYSIRKLRPKLFQESASQIDHLRSDERSRGDSMQPDSLVIRLNQAKTLVADITFFEGPGLNCCKPKKKRSNQSLDSIGILFIGLPPAM